jgi:hypothetical protein
LELPERIPLLGCSRIRAAAGVGPPVTARVLSLVIGHTWDIYGQMDVRLRLNGITPPANQRF